MHIASFEVSKLYGRFNYNFDLHYQGEKLNLFHGLNGSGKTKILELLRLICARDLTALEQQPFEQLKVVYSDHSELIFNRSNLSDVKALFRRDKNSDFVPLKRRWADIDDKQRMLRRPTKGRADFISFVNRRYSHFLRVGPEEWVDTISDIHYKTEELFNTLEDALPIAIKKNFIASTYSYDLKHLPKLNIISIDTKRLMLPSVPHDTEFEEQYLSALEALSAEISQQIIAAISQYALKTQELDGAYVSKISNKLSLNYSLQSSEVKATLNSLQKKEEALKDAGLLGATLSQLTIFGDLTNENQPLLNVIDVHCENTQEKLAIFDDIYQKINLLTTIVDKRFSYKFVRISSSGLSVIDKEDGSLLPLDGLSSGEQHELYLLASLIFQTSQPDMLFIDEPEISLHIAWQDDFVDDLLQIKNLEKTQIFIATHSPSIIGRRFSSAFDLQDLNSRKN